MAAVLVCLLLIIISILLITTLFQFVEIAKINSIQCVEGWYINNKIITFYRKVKWSLRATFCLSVRYSEYVPQKDISKYLITIELILLYNEKTFMVQHHPKIFVQDQ